MLKSGNLSLLYKDGEIRQVFLGRIQVLNAIYAAVRDRNWTTVPFKIGKETVEEGENGFRIALELDYSLGKIQYGAEISIEGNEQRLDFQYNGTAGSTFLRNRIGLCILHPIKECRGKPVLITHSDGSQSEGRFPEFISPHQPFFNISSMQWRPVKEIDASLSFEGEIFESEDQRNWTDASYKTYCTPLELPFPAEVKKGEQLHQRITLQVDARKTPVHFSDPDREPFPFPEKRVLKIHPQRTSLLPALGVARSTEFEPMSEKEKKLLSRISFQQYRVDLHLSREGWIEEYESAAEEQNWLKWPLELVLHFGANPANELDAFLKKYTLVPVKIRHIMIFDQDFLSNQELLDLVVPGLKTAIPESLLGGGTDANFAELNRKPPDSGLLDFISYSICPQIHAFDKLTLLENLEAQAESVISAKKLLGKPVSVGAISLKQRFNAVATNADDGSVALPESDPRQHTSFTAGWTLSSIRNLTLAGAASLTYFETVGPRGILSRQDVAGAHSPLYALFNDLLSDEHMQVIHTKSSHPLEFDGLALQGQKENTLLLANFTETELSIEIADHPGIPNTLILKPSEIHKICYST